MALVACSECRSQVSDKAVSCPHCGNVFNRCPECATEVPAGAATCANCGYPFAVAPTEQPLSTAPRYASEVLPANTQHFSIEGAVGPVVYAGFWRRFAALILDSIVVGVILGVGDFLLALFFGNGSSTYTTLSYAYSIGLGIAYYVGLESGRSQATIGKRALGIVVTDLQGNRISAGRALGRYLAKILSACTLLIGFLMAGFTEKRQGLHDMMAGTLVVVKRTSH